MVVQCITLHHNIMSFNLDEFDPLASPKPNQPSINNNVYNTQQLQQALPNNMDHHNTQLVPQSQPQPHHTPQSTRRSTNRSSGKFIEYSGTLDIAANKLQQSRSNNNSTQNSPHRSANNSNNNNHSRHISESDESDDQTDESTDNSDNEQSSDTSASDNDNSTTTHTKQYKDGTSKATRITKSTTAQPFTQYDVNDKCSVHGCIQKRLPQTRTCPIHSTTPLKPVGNKSSDQWSIQYSKSQTSFGMNKNICYWHIIDKSQPYDIELFHSTLGGKRVIKINGQTRINEKKVNDTGSRYNFQLGRDKRTSISIELRVAGLIGHTYELFINGRPYDEAKKFWLYNDNA